VGGTGAGQWATITAISSDGHTVTVNNPWAVLPVNGSRYATFDWSSANWIIAGNTATDNEKGIEFFSASIRDILVTNNSLTNNGEILISPTEQPYGAGLFNVVLNTQVLNNTLIDNNGLRPAAISAVSREDYEDNNIGTAIIGLEVRGNSITGSIPNTVYSDASLDDAKALSEGFNVYWQWQTAGTNFVDDGTPSILGTISQGNTLTNSFAALQTNSAVSQTVLAGDTLNNVSTPIVDSILPGDTHGSVGTTTVSTSSPNPPTTVSTIWNQLTIGSYPASILSGQPASTTSFLLPTSEYQIGSGPDSLSMLAQQVTTDMTAIARISVPSSASAATQGLLVFRATSSPTSAFFAFGQSQTGQIIFEWRAYEGGGVGGYTFPYATTPVWVKISKSGNVFEAYFSADGSAWNYGGIVGADFFGGYYVGLASLSDTLTGPPILIDNVDGP
jgi:parallel beta-helix repeat protein